MRGVCCGVCDSPLERELTDDKMDDCGVADALEGVTVAIFVGVFVGVLTGVLACGVDVLVAAFPGVRVTPCRKGELTTGFIGLRTSADTARGERRTIRGISTDSSLRVLGDLDRAAPGLATPDRSVIPFRSSDASS